MSSGKPKYKPAPDHPAIADRLGDLLDKYHWKLLSSHERLTCIEYRIVPRWDYWVERNDKCRQLLYERKE